MANLLRAHLLKDPHVTFAGYRGTTLPPKSCIPPHTVCRIYLTPNTYLVPHPLFATIELRVQTDGTITPKEAVITTSKNLLAELGQLSREFTKEFELRKAFAGNATDAAQQ